MTQRFHFAFAAILVAMPLMAADPEPLAKKADTVKVTYLITGLHCPPCTRTVESAMKKNKGISSITVDWKTKNAHVEFDESILSAQKVAQLIAATPHMMGSDMHYGGWLALKIDSIKDEASAKPATEALGKIPGVAKVVAYPKSHSVGVQFTGEGTVTSQDLIGALKEAGIEATTKF